MHGEPEATELEGSLRTIFAVDPLAFPNGFFNAGVTDPNKRERLLGEAIVKKLQLKRDRQFVASTSPELTSNENARLFDWLRNCYHPGDFMSPSQ
jgi:hypothetical protein